jgi:hypothetical protein
MSDLIDSGCMKMRLPNWAVGYAVPRPAGPLADVFDVLAGIGGGEPIPILIVECDRHTNWEPMS